MKNRFNADEILKALPEKYYVIHLDTKVIVQSNDPGVNLNSDKCYQYLFKNNFPCENDKNCVCRQAPKEGNQNFIFEKSSNGKSQAINATFSLVNKDFLFVCLKDVTEEFEAKKELKINSKRLKRAERLADFGFWEFNVDEKIMIASNGAIKIYGAPGPKFSLEEAQKYPLKEFREKLDKELDDLINLGKPYNIKFQIKRPTDGEIRHIHSIAEYREDKRMVFGVIHDITDTELTHKALAESENNLKHLFENMNSGFAFHKVVTDDKGKVVDYIFLAVNDKFAEITGLTRDQVLNKTILEVLPKTEKTWIERYGEVALYGNPITFTEYSSQIGKHFEISAYSPKKNYFAVTFTDVTDRVNSEIALKESLEDLNRAQKFAKIGNWKYDPAIGKVYWSDQVFEIFERDPSEGVLESQEVTEYFTKEDYSRISKAVLKTLEDKISFQLQSQIKLAGNKSKWIELICQAPTDEEQDSKLVLQGTIQDITTSKKAEEEISKTDKLLRTVIDNIPDAIYMKDVQFRKLIANKADAINCGAADVKEIIGKTDYDIYPKEVADGYSEDDRKVIEKGEIIINREEILPAKDKNRIILTTKFPLLNNENEIIGLVGIGRDITERKENEKRLRLLQQTIEQSPLSVLITNKEGKIEYINPAFTAVTGYSIDEAEGQNPGTLLEEGKNHESLPKDFIEALRLGHRWGGELRSKKKDGTFFWNSVVFAPILDDNDNVQHFVAISEDVSEKKKMYEELKIAKEEAEESNRLKSIFLTNLSHEIRTPLNGILGFSSLICSGITDADKLKSYGKIVENSGRRLTKVIEDIIDMSVLQTGQVDLELSEFDLNEVLNELYKSYKDIYEDCLDKVNFEMQPCTNEKVIIQSDKVRLKQAFGNVIDNAFKFTDKGFIRFGYFDSNDKQITLFVEDTGIGIDKNKLGVIFEPFRQVEEGDSRRYEGSGLGLAISAAISEKLGGSIHVVSEKGKGSVFYFMFNKKADI